MMRLATTDRLEASAHDIARRLAAMVFEQFAETMKGRTSDRYRSGRILKLILNSDPVVTPPDSTEPVTPIRLTAIVNHPKLGRRDQDWHLIRDRLRRAWQLGEIDRPARIDIHSLQQVNEGLANGIPHFITTVTRGHILYETDDRVLTVPRLLSHAERIARGRAEFERWQERANAFLAGADFYASVANRAMALWMVHQACEHLYQSVIWALTLHGRRTHDLDDLRSCAEAQDCRLASAWPRETAEHRNAFGQLCHAYVEARYSRNFYVAPEILAWVRARAHDLQNLARNLCHERLALTAPAPLSLAGGFHEAS